MSIRSIAGRFAMASLAVALTGVTSCWASSGAIGLDEAIRRTREGSLVLRNAGMATDAARSRARDAGAVPNPSLAAALENVGGGLGSDRAESSLLIEQTVELGGDRGARTGLAGATVMLSQAQREQLASALDGETVERFCSAWTLQERVQRLRDAERVAEQAVEAAEERLKAGAAPAFEKSRAAAFRSLRRIERLRLEAELISARRRLALLWGEDAAGFDSLFLPEPSPPALPSLDQLRAGLDAHPGRRRAAAETAVEGWRVRETRAARVPDLQLGAGVRHLAEAGGTGLLFGLSLPLPLWSSQRGSAAAAESELAAAVSRERLAAIDAGDELESAYGRYVAAVSAWEGVRDEVRPAAEETMRLILGGYRSGRLSSLEVQDGQRGLIEAETLWIEACADVWRNEQALARLAGAAWDAQAPGKERR